MSEPIKPFSTCPETRDELLKFAREIDKSPVPEVLDKEASDFVRAAYALADMVKGQLEDEKFAEEKGVYDDDWRPIATAPKDACIILAVTGGSSGPIVGEARWQENGEDSDWYWAGNGPGDYHGGPISEINLGKASHWQPLPAPPKATITEDVA